ncbi:undecaprenyl-diphosphate phosphatase [Alkalicoccus chagannorensis]|uniref:undecaprenyl-diphosphate phosphatase n=1 Tax=Alkalicoccus chagannorensis TaxID=427072 RepID=UPI0004120BE5|nr:undecaprenyl-diphosphate phosphatase [Alkalicoccus chagannorensis]
MEEVVSLLQYIFLGLIQGLTEPLPVSSSGHLRIFSHFFGITAPDLHLEVFLNAASLVAVFLVYRKDLTDMMHGTLQYVMKKDKNYYTQYRFAWLVIIGTIPAVIIGGLFADVIGGELTAIHFVAGALLITGLALWLIRNLRGSKTDGEITVADSLVVGFAQTLALAPGISRSGATVVAALARKVEPETALKFSFFLSIPVSIGSLVFMIPEVTQALTTPGLTIPYIVSFFVSVVVSIFAIKLFINLAASGNMGYFAMYCFSVSIFLFIFG